MYTIQKYTIMETIYFQNPGFYFTNLLVVSKFVVVKKVLKRILNSK